MTPKQAREMFVRAAGGKPPDDDAREEFAGMMYQLAEWMQSTADASATGRALQRAASGVERLANELTDEARPLTAKEARAMFAAIDDARTNREWRNRK